MAKMVEYLNPKSHTIQLTSPDRKVIKIPAKSKIILSDWYLNYCPKYLRVVRMIGENKALTPKNINKPKYTPTNKSRQNRVPQRPKKRTPASTRRERLNRKEKVKVQVPNKIKGKAANRNKVVGKRSKENTNHLFQKACRTNEWSISNNIGIGILSFNRLKSLQRLISSIRQNTDLNRTTVFVSDESTNKDVVDWLSKQTDIVVLTRQKRLGVAGNSNRLLKCLSRFKYGILLNDDVEILQPGWETFYCNAAEATNYHHFCYHQVGIYGAKKPQKVTNFGGHRINTITERPHGAVMFYTNELFNKIGYFDEQFGYYGMEHVDWSTRASQAGFQPQGYHDVAGSNRYFKMHQEKSVVPQRTAELAKARNLYKNISSPSRVYVKASTATEVPSITTVIPIRNIGRGEAVKTVVNSIRSQLFPNIEIIIAEQDETKNPQVSKLGPCKYLLAKSKYSAQPFTKAMAFNLGVANATNPKIVLHDADIVPQRNYVNKIYSILDSHDGVHIGAKVLYINEASSRQINRLAKIDPKKECERVVTYFEGGSLACTKKAYFSCGGFNEIFEGYGIEDCDFFDRLKYNTKFYNERSEDFVHLWHGRTTGWQRYHRRNKQIGKQIRTQYSLPVYIKSLVGKIKKLYPGVAKELQI